MSRRSKVDTMDLVSKVIDLYQNKKMTHKEIEELLRDEGFEISRESVRRYIKSAQEVSDQYKKAVDDTKVLIETVKDNPNTDVLEVTTSLIAKHIFDAVRSVDSIEFENDGDMVTALLQLVNSQTKIAKLRLTYRSGYDAAKKDLLSMLSIELKKYPEILEKLDEIVSKMESPEK